MRLFRKKTAPAQPRRIPTHIAIVMDGNGRWAKQRGLPRPAGHKAGAESFRTIANYAKSIGLQYLTVYAFSTENWKRPEDEVDAIMDLLEKYLREAIRDMDRNRVRFCFFGDLSRLSPELRREAQEAVERSKKYEGVQVNFCLNYGGRDEIVRAGTALCRAVRRRRAPPGGADGGYVLRSALFCRGAGSGSLSSAPAERLAFPISCYGSRLMPNTILRMSSGRTSARRSWTKRSTPSTRVIAALEE